MGVARVAVVSGGAGGIGAEICRQLAARSVRVAVLDREPDATERVAADVDGLGVVADVTDPGAVTAAVAEVTAGIGAPTILVNAVGWDEMRPFLDTDEELQARLIDINLHGPIRLTRAVLPHMVEAGWGRIVNIASDAGRVGSSLEAIYAAAKGGLIAFTKTIAREFARHGITANCVSPGPADTPMLARLAAQGGVAAKVVGRLAEAIPMRRLARPEDVAAAVVFLASDEAGYITGQTLSVSGGLTMV